MQLAVCRVHDNKDFHVTFMLAVLMESSEPSFPEALSVERFALIGSATRARCTSGMLPVS